MGRYLWAEVLLFEVLHIIVLYPTRQDAYRVVVLTAMVYVAAQIFLTPEFTDPPVVTYTVGGMIAFHFAFTAYLLFAEGTFPNHWRRVRDEVHAKADASGLDNLPSSFPLTEKFWWMVDIAYGIRMIGWVQEPINCLPPHPPPSRRDFLWKTLLKFIFHFAALDLTTGFLFSGNPAFDSRMHDPTDGPETYLAAVPLLHRIPYILGYGIIVGATVSVAHNMIALVCIGLGRSSPTLWPDMWGRWGDAYTVRKLWGQTWHQRMRPTFVGLGRLVANKFLKFPRGTNGSSYAQLYIAFLLSGILHFAADFMMEKRMVYRSFNFFLLQAIAITFEDFVIYITKSLLIQRGIELRPGKIHKSWAEAVVRVIGYCWVVVWFCLTLPVWLDGASTIGLNNVDRGAGTKFLLDTWKRWT
ncbi:hypothetical protein BDM02DRAFT_3172253 [Thelephora ganbajun]|uniref:Uncharacterized protein n=1 Tax=Thelephora ganbajun TaxID=370292 RepID=A0ACB6Z939_THEGA|nr:hypothetical protein BDM02DRAFT_3172253 [Thelephora ganbajun]